MERKNVCYDSAMYDIIIICLQVSPVTHTYYEIYINIIP